MPPSLKKRRGTYRGLQTKDIMTAKDMLTQTITEDGIIKLEAILKSIQKRARIIDELNEKILESMSNDTGLEAEILEQYSESQTNQDIYFIESKCALRHEPDTTSPSVHRSGGRDVYKIKKLSLPTFSGKQIAWKGFYEEFQAAVDQDEGMTSITKFRYLRDCVKDEARRAIEGLPLNEQSYKEATAILKNRYDDDQKIVDSLVQAILDLEAPSMDPVSLMTFYDQIETYIRGLATLGKNEEHIGEFILPIVKRKLPPSIKTQIRRQTKTFNSFKKFRQALFDEIQAIQEGGQSHQPEEQSFGSKSSAAFLTRMRSPSPNMRKNPCAFCKKMGHKAVECTTVSDHTKRLEIVNKDNLCYNCLGPHNRSDCQSVFRCILCNERHHSSLHQAFEHRSRSRSPSREGTRGRYRSPSPGRRAGTPVPLNRQATTMNFTDQKG